MIYLFIHQNFPAQYKNIIRYLADQPGNTVVCISKPNDNVMRDVIKATYEIATPRHPNHHPLTADFDGSVRNAMGVVDACRELINQGLKPDIIIGHNGWGEMMFVKDMFPKVPVLLYFEFYYHSRGVDVGFDPEYPGDQQLAFRLRCRNAVNLLSMEVADWGNSPTRWQRSVQPPEIRPRISVLHEGVRTDQVRPDPAATLSLARDGLELTRKDEVVTFVARSLEPYRGFHIFMRAWREIQRRRPKAHALIVGADNVSYGAPPPPGTTFRAMALEEAGGDLDMSRVHFLGQIPYEAYLRLLQVSSAHVYLTYPFVLSWSFIEAMSAGCAVIGSSTPPVMEVLRDGENGLAVDFFSAREIADRVDEVLDHPTRMAHIREAARATAVRDFDFDTVLRPRWTGLIDDLASGRRPQLYVD
ncbi:MAG TPA: glycosyltransferase family 4 protein [Caulobacteraceae bacterium]|nr:glycosyltransferase family 4 protein [Caulobacteraceae bacterium]